MKISQTDDLVQAIASGTSKSKNGVDGSNQATIESPMQGNSASSGNFLERLQSRKPVSPKELSDPNSYDKEGNLKPEFIPLAIIYNLQVHAFNKTVDRVFRMAEVKLNQKGFNENLTNSRNRQSNQSQIQSNEAMMELLSRLRVEMGYEWIWDTAKQERIRVLVPKRV